MGATSFIERARGPDSTRVVVSEGGLFEGCGLSRVGRQRPDNQDRFALRIRSAGEQTGYVCVADGVGGAPAGRLASAIAVTTATRILDEALPGAAELDVEETLRRVVRDCQSAIEGHVAGHPEAWGMATTLTLGCVVWPKLHLAHVGDSRAYLLRGSRLRRLTRDHTCAQALIDRGVIEKGSEGAARWRNVILNLVGGRSAEVEPDVSSIRLRGGDLLLWCTDGLTDSLDDSRIGEILGTPAPAREMCTRLVVAAQEEEARDDVTAVVVRFSRRGVFRRIQGWLSPAS